MNRRTHPLEAIAAWVLALLWLAPLAYAFWSAFPSEEWTNEIARANAHITDLWRLLTGSFVTMTKP